MAVKSAQHFRAAYGPMSADIAVVDDGDGVTSKDFLKRRYAKVRRPIWPLDEDFGQD